MLRMHQCLELSRPFRRPLREVFGTCRNLTKNIHKEFFLRAQVIAIHAGPSCCSAHFMQVHRCCNVLIPNIHQKIINTLMLEGYDVPFKYKRKSAYKNLEGARVNLTYYSETKSVSGVEFETMKVVL